MLALLALMGAAEFVRVEGPDLREGLIAYAEARLAPMGLHVDGSRAWLSAPADVLHAEAYEVREEWGTDVPGMPLEFAVRVDQKLVRVTLAAPLLRDVLVATHVLHKGSPVACNDFSVERRAIRAVPRGFAPAPCSLDTAVVALRDVTAHDVVRAADFGKALDVTAGQPVRVEVAANGISIATTAVALADARIGDLVDVRLRQPARILRTRVTGASAVSLTESAP